MADVVIVQDSSEEEHSHCPECEAKFAAIEQRLVAIEQHHPVMDANTEEAQDTAEEALETAEQALEMATEAIVEQIIEEQVPPPVIEEPREEEESHAGQESSGHESGGTGEEAGVRPGILEEETSEERSGEPVIIAIEPEPERKPAARKRHEPGPDTHGLRFNRGGKRPA